MLVTLSEELKTKFEFLFDHVSGRVFDRIKYWFYIHFHSMMMITDSNMNYKLDVSRITARLIVNC